MQGIGTKSNLHTNIVRILNLPSTIRWLGDCNVFTLSGKREMMLEGGGEPFVDPLACLGPSVCTKDNCRIYFVCLFDGSTIT